MGEAKRRKAAKSRWDDPAARSDLLALAHHAMATDPDPTLTGITVIFPSGETKYLSATEARKPPPKAKS